jgi:CRISPR/Cas system CMR subunit Cmr6 (Cas7 group RAMP superfamily)
MWEPSQIKTGKFLCSNGFECNQQKWDVSLTVDIFHPHWNSKPRPKPPGKTLVQTMGKTLGHA